MQPFTNAHNRMGTCERTHANVHTRTQTKAPRECMHVNARAQMHAHECAHTNARKSTYASLCMLMHARMHRHGRTHERMHPDTNARAHVNARTRMHACECAHTNVRIHAPMRPHTHEPTHESVVHCNGGTRFSAILSRVPLPATQQVCSTCAYSSAGARVCYASRQTLPPSAHTKVQPLSKPSLTPNVIPSPGPMWVNVPLRYGVRVPA